MGVPNLSVWVSMLVNAMISARFTRSAISRQASTRGFPGPLLAIDLDELFGDFRLLPANSLTHPQQRLVDAPAQRRRRLRAGRSRPECSSGSSPVLALIMRCSRMSGSR